MFEVGGIPYRYLPETFWQPLPGSRAKYLGEAFDDHYVYSGGISFNIYSYEDGDMGKYFVELTAAERDSIYSCMNRITVYYYRADIELPPFDRTGIDEVGYENDCHKVRQIVKNADTVNELFDAINNGPHSRDIDEYYYYYKGQIWCMNSNFPGIGIELPIFIYDQDYWIEIASPDGSFYARIPQGLLETIVGEKLPTASEYIASQREKESS